MPCNVGKDTWDTSIPTYIWNSVGTGLAEKNQPRMERFGTKNATTSNPAVPLLHKTEQFNLGSGDALATLTHSLTLLDT